MHKKGTKTKIKNTPLNRTTNSARTRIIRIDINVIENITSSSFMIHSNVINITKRYAIYKNDKFIKNYDLKKVEELYVYF